LFLFSEGLAEEEATDQPEDPESDNWLVWVRSDRRRKREARHKRDVRDFSDARDISDARDARDARYVSDDGDADGVCPDAGVFDLAACKFGAPLVLSWSVFSYFLWCQFYERQRCQFLQRHG
jgi:hypothetical protein